MLAARVTDRDIVWVRVTQRFMMDRLIYQPGDLTYVLGHLARRMVAEGYAEYRFPAAVAA